MPRAFLLTNNRFKVLMRPFSRESSPENSVQTAEEKLHRQRMAKIITEDQSTESSASTDQFYNLTKLAEVSLAEAAGKIFQRNSESKQNDGNIIRNDDNDVEYSYSHKIFDKMARKKKVKREMSEDAHDKLDYDIKLPETPQDISTASSASSEDSHECPDCGKKYSTSSNLARHRQTHRSLGDKKARRCPHCDKVYVSMPAFSMHVRTHNQGCKCHYCGKCFSRPWLLQGHIRTHTGEKPFKCQVCSKAFADKSNLRAHVQTHSNTKPHVCGRCGKAFALKSYLYKHEESSCMRIHGKNISRESSPDFSNQSSQPSDMSTRISEGFSVIQSPERPTTSPDYPCATLNLSNEYSIAMNHEIRTNSNYSNYENCYRTSVISTNRDAYSTFSPIIYNNKYNEENVQDQPVDFSPKTGKQIVYSTIGDKLQMYKTNERSTAFQIGMAIAV